MNSISSGEVDGGNAHSFAKVVQLSKMCHGFSSHSSEVSAVTNMVNYLIVLRPIMQLKDVEMELSLGFLYVTRLKN